MAWGSRLALAAAALVALACGPAWADFFNFSYSNSTILASGTLAATLQSGNVYLITAIAGTRNGQAITGLLAPNTFSNFSDGCTNCNDNFLYFPAGGSNPAGSAYVDINGFAYSTASGNFEVYFLGSSYFEDTPTTSLSLASFAVSNPGPSPGSGALSYMIVMLGGAWRWRRSLRDRLRDAVSRIRARVPLRRLAPIRI